LIYQPNTCLDRAKRGAAVIGGIIAGMFFVAVLAITSYSLESQPPKVAPVVDGIPHYGALRSYDWASASGGGGSHYIGKCLKPPPLFGMALQLVLAVLGIGNWLKYHACKLKIAHALLTNSEIANLK
jgi:hypothetical protein